MSTEPDNFLKIWLKARPIDERANGRLRWFLAERLKVPGAAVRILPSRASRTKGIYLAGVTQGRVFGVLSEKSASGQT
jgi:uncharacterized protein YggU (UPF0235/DUF167 family)